MKSYKMQFLSSKNLSRFQYCTRKKLTASNRRENSIRISGWYWISLT